MPVDPSNHRAQTGLGVRAPTHLRAAAAHRALEHFPSGLRRPASPIVGPCDPGPDLALVDDVFRSGPVFVQVPAAPLHVGPQESRMGILPPGTPAFSGVVSQFDPWNHMRINPGTRILDSQLDSSLQERVHKVSESQDPCLDLLVVSSGTSARIGIFRSCLCT